MFNVPAVLIRARAAVRRPCALMACVVSCIVLLSTSPDTRAQNDDACPHEPAYSLVDQAFRSFAEQEHVPGMVYGIVKEGRLVHCGTLGVRDIVTGDPVTFDTSFRMASMTKSFTALAVLKLRDGGKLALESPAARWLPEIARIRFPAEDARDIRIRDLLAHTAGFVTDDPWGDRQLNMPEAEFTELIGTGIPSAQVPGAAYEYSNYGYALLGHIVGNVSGVPLQKYVEQEILRPLGMRSTVWEVAGIDPQRRAVGYRYEEGRWSEEPVLGDGAFGAMGGLHTSARDYAAYVGFLLASWSDRDPQSARIVAKHSRRELAVGSSFPLLLPADPADPTSCQAAQVYGFGMRVYADCRVDFAVTHSGGLPGYGSSVLLLPDYDVGIFAFANRTYTPMIKVVRRAAARLYDTGMLTKRTPSPSDSLEQVREAIMRMYSAGSVRAVPTSLANNLLLDSSAEKRDLQLAALKLRLGACSTASLEPKHALAGVVVLGCERGTLVAKVVLAPVTEPSIQSLEFSARD